MRTIITFLILSSCGTDETLIPSYDRDADLVSYEASFKEDAKSHGCSLIPIDLRVLKRVEILEENFVGLCEEYEFSPDKIDLVNKRKVWFEIRIKADVQNELQLRDLTYHELSHCYLDYEHSDDPDDIMYTHLHQIDYLVSSDWEQRKDVLFDKCSR